MLNFEVGTPRFGLAYWDSQNQTSRTPRTGHPDFHDLIRSPALGLPGSNTQIQTPRDTICSSSLLPWRLCGSLGDALRSLGEPLWLPWSCVEIPWGTSVAALGLPGGAIGHLCGFLGAGGRSHGAPLWLPGGCLEVPWGTSVAPLGHLGSQPGPRGS